MRTHFETQIPSVSVRVHIKLFDGVYWKDDCEKVFQTKDTIVWGDDRVMNIVYTDPIHRMEMSENLSDKEKEHLNKNMQMVMQYLANEFPSAKIFMHYETTEPKNGFRRILGDIHEALLFAIDEGYLED